MQSVDSDNQCDSMTQVSKDSNNRRLDYFEIKSVLRDVPVHVVLQL